MEVSSGTSSRSASEVGMRTASGESLSWSSGLRGWIAPSPAPQASKTAQGEGVPDLVLSDVKSQMESSKGSSVIFNEIGVFSFVWSTGESSLSSNDAVDLNRHS